MFLAMLVCSGPAKAAGCGDVKPYQTKIKVELELPDPLYDFKSDIDDINKDKKISDDWITRHGMQKVWKSSNMETLGFAEGAAGLVSGYGIQVKKYDMYGVYYCPYITHVDVAMMFRTRIVIPKNFPKNGCRFNLIHEHELRHYNANREVALKFVERLNHDLPVIVKEMENAQPYVLGEKVPATIETLKARMKDAVEAYIIQAMSEELTRRNDLIDTPEEYASNGPKLRACKD